MAEKGKEQNSIMVKLRKAEWRRLKKWLDDYDNVVVGVGGCPKVYLVNLTKIHGKGEEGETENEQRK